MTRVARKLLLSLLPPFVLLAFLLLAVNTGPGRRLVVWVVIEASGGQVVPSGLSGNLPLAPRLANLEIRDGQGAWLRIDDAALTLDKRRLLHGELAVSSLTARSVSLLRLSERAEADRGPLRLPFRVLVRHVGVEEFVFDVWPDMPRLAIEGNGTCCRRDARVSLVATVPGRADRYRLEAVLATGRCQLSLGLREAPGGLTASLIRAAGVTLPPKFGAWTLDAAAEGPPRSLTLRGRLNAGSSRLTIDGSLDLESRASDGLRLAAELPAMTLGSGTTPAIAWRRIRIAADLSGLLHAPRGNARMEAEGLVAGTLSAERISATFGSDRSRLQLLGELQGLRAPLELPNSAMDVPVRLWGEMEPHGSGRPFRIAIQHPLLELATSGTLAAGSAHAAVRVPDLAAFSNLVGVPLAGSAAFNLRAARAGPPGLAALGELRLTQAPSPVLALLGPLANVALAAQGEGDGWRIESARIDGQHVAAAVRGKAGPERLELGWDLELPDLAALVPGWSGKGAAQGAVSGSVATPNLVADVGAEGHLPGWGRARVAGRLVARPAERGGSLELSGDWGGQPVSVSLSAGRSDDGLALTLADSRWASMTLGGGLHLPPKAPWPRGEIHVSVARLADFAPLLSPLLSPGRSSDLERPELAGSLDARLVLEEAEGAGSPPRDMGSCCRAACGSAPSN